MIDATPSQPRSPISHPPAEWGSLRRSMSFIFLGNIIYAACQLATVVAVVRFGSPELVGQFALGLAVSAPIMMLSALQLGTLLTTDQKDAYRFREYLVLRIAASFVGLAAVAVVTVAVGYGRQAACVILAVALAKVIELVGDIFHGLFQKNDRMGRIAVSLTVKGLLALVSLSIVIAVTKNMALGALAMAAAWLAVLLVYDAPQAWRLLRQTSPANRATSSMESPLNLRAMGKLLLLGVPLGVVVALNSLNLNIPRYVLESSYGERELGIFAALAAFMRVGFLFEAALGRSALPRLARLHAEGLALQFQRTLYKLLAAVAVAGAAGVLLSLLLAKPLLAAIYDPQYAEQAASLHLLMLAAGIGYVAGVLKLAVDATRTFVAQVPLFVTAAVVTAVASLLLVPAWGIAGAAASLIAAKVVLVAGYAAMLVHMATKETTRLAASAHS